MKNHDALFPEASVLGRRWEVAKTDERQALALEQKLGITGHIARLLVNRNISLEEAENFINPSIRSSLPDPSHILDMDIAVERLVRAIEAGEKITIFGDYDVDGGTSSAILKRYFRMIGISADIYIPDRVEEGYGPNVEALTALYNNGTKVVIIVDCGTLSHDVFREIEPLGLDTIIVDHHLGIEERPKVLALINPNRLDEKTEYRYLAAVGVAFLFIVALNRALREKGWFKDKKEPDLLSLLDLVALGTVCDVMPLKGLNRAYVAQGLKIMARRENVGLAVLSDMARLKEPPDVYHAGFVIGPRINAGGRIGKSDLGARLLSTDNPEEAFELAETLEKLNTERRAIESLVMDEAILQAESQHNNPVIMLVGYGWHSGVIGIVASRIKERYDRPVASISVENNIGKGSARSITGVDIGAAIISAKMQGLLIKGGGHAMAAGFSVEESKIKELHEFLNSNLEKHVANNYEKITKIDDVLSLGAINLDFVSSLKLLAPFGQGNPEPRFCIYNAKCVHSEVIANQHIRMVLTDDTPNSPNRLYAIAFRAVGTKLEEAINKSKGKSIHVLGSPKLDYWNSEPRISFRIDDIIIV